MADPRITVEIPEFEGIDLADDVVSGLEDALSDVASERGRQIQLGYDAAHDDAHSFSGLEDHLRELLRKAEWAPADDPIYRTRLVRLAALAVAMIETLDRRDFLGVEDADPGATEAAHV